MKYSNCWKCRIIPLQHIERGPKKNLRLKDAIRLRRNHKKIEEERITLKKRQILLGKTTYLFSLLKSLNILNSYLEKTNKKNKGNENEDNL